MRPRTPAALGLALALVPALAGQSLPRVEYRDNPRPIRLRFGAVEAGIERLQVILAEPPGALLEVEFLEGAGVAARRRRIRNATQRAKVDGQPLPMTAYVGTTLGRFARSHSGKLQLFWGGKDHLARGSWPWQGGTRGPLFDAAQALEATLQSEDPDRWLGYARSLPAGSTLELLFRDGAGSVRIMGGREQEARHAADRFLRSALREGLGWRPARGMHSPSFLAETPGSIGGVLLAGPVVLTVGSNQPEARLRALAEGIERPLPAAPQVGPSPLAPGP